MMRYSYVAISATGEHITGAVEARGRDDVIGQLERRGAYAVDVVALGEGPAAEGDRREGWSLYSRRPSAAQITMLTRELAMLLRAGLPLPQALALLQKDAGSTRLRQLIAGISARLNDGASFCQALEPAGAAFPKSYTSMIQVAEASGSLDKVLERIAETREREQKLRAKIVSALIYPALLILTAIGAVSVMLLFVVPRFKTMIETAGTELPPATRFVMAASGWLSANIDLLAFGTIGLVAAIALARRSALYRSRIDALIFALPVIGRLARLNLTIQFTRSMGTLLENGVGLPRALQLTAEVVTNRRAGDVIRETHKALRKGQDFTGPLAASGLFMPAAISMLRVGQETGGLAECALHLARMFEDKLETSIARLFTIIEPVIIITVSLFVAAIIISIIGAVVAVNDLAL